MCGPPGNGRPSSRATLSNASPAASSMVAPSGSTPTVTSSTRSRQEWPPRDQQRQARLGQRAVLELVDGDVRGEVVDAVDRLAEPDRQRLGRGHADQQRAGQARAAGDRDRVDVVEADAGGRRTPARWSAPSPRGAPGWRPRARRRRTGRAPRRCWRPRRPAACGRGRCRHRSRRTRSRCRGPGAVVHASHPPAAGRARTSASRAVAVVARPAVDLGEPAAGVERERRRRCPRRTSSSSRSRAAAARRRERPRRAGAGEAAAAGGRASTAIRCSSATSPARLTTA